MKRSKFFALIVALIGLSSLSSCGYNRLVEADENCNAKWAQVENAYQRRADLIPNIVEAVKGEADFEKSTLTEVMEARASATKVTIDPSKMTQEDIDRYQEAQNTFGGTIGRLMTIVESYPNLQANQAFRDLRVELEGTENRISVERKNFIDAVQQYNTMRRSFPRNITASLFGFEARPTFKASEGSDKAPKVDFSSDKKEDNTNTTTTPEKKDSL